MKNSAASSGKPTLTAGGSVQFKTVHKARRYHQVAEQIQRLIAQGVLRPGDRLPAERDLAAQLGVSRSSVRDAIRTLEVTGLLESHHGRGTVIRDLSTDSLVVPLASVLVRKRGMVAELLDVRRMIEPALAARAAQHASGAQIAQLEDILRRQWDKMRRGEDAIAEDSEFHRTIALAAKNSVVLRVLDVLMDLLRESRNQSLQVRGRRERSYAGHVRVLNAIKRRDPAGASRAARQHLTEIQGVVMRQFQSEA
jgi:GntR family transcriptional regulator, transcriptional repressor for pyruvate dehydrogenase complex